MVVALDWETDGLYPHRGHYPFLLGMEDERGRVIRCEVWRDSQGRPVRDDLEQRALPKGVLGCDSPEFQEIREVVEDPNTPKLAHNAKFEIRMARAMGWEPAGRWIDTMVLAVLVNEYSRLGLDVLARQWFDITHSETDVIARWLAVEKRRRRRPWLKALRLRTQAEFGTTWKRHYEARKKAERHAPAEPTYQDFYEANEENAATMARYLENDLDDTLKLYFALHPMTDYAASVRDNEEGVIYEVANMEDAGIHVDRAFCKERRAHYTAIAKRHRKQMFRVAGSRFNPNSPQQLKAVLKNNGYDVPNTAQDTLNQLEGDFPLHLLEYRASTKFARWFKTFIENSSDDYPVIHPSIWQNGQSQGIKTGRFSITDPAFQTLPGGYRGVVSGESGLDVRRAVVPAPGTNLYMLDYMQVEPRIFGHYTGEQRIIRALENGEDIYLAFVKVFFRNDWKHKHTDPVWLAKKRSDTKTLVLSLIYGMGAATLAMRLGTTVDLARGMRAQCLREFPSITELMNKCMRDLARNGYCEDAFGRRYHVPIQLSYKGMNAIIQGAAAQVMKRAIRKTGAIIADWNNAFQHAPVRAQLALTVHDELVFCIPQNAENALVPRLVDAMENAAPELTVPLGVDVKYSPNGKSWGDKVKWETLKAA